MRAPTETAICPHPPRRQDLTAIALPGRSKGRDTEIERVSAASIEATVADQLRALPHSPRVVAAAWRAARSEIEGVSEDVARDALKRLDQRCGLQVCGPISGGWRRL